VADDKEKSRASEDGRPAAKIIPLVRPPVYPLRIAPDQAGAYFPCGLPDESSRVEFDLLDQDLRGLKRRYAAALEKKAETADQPQVAVDFRAIAERVAASFDSLIRLSDHLVGLPHDNDDEPA
jgi:hypothetical protein